MIDLNVRGLTDLTLQLLPYMQARGSGGVINLSSMAAFMPGPYMAVYYATKAYVLSFTEALASELDGSGVTVCAAFHGPLASRVSHVSPSVVLPAAPPPWEAASVTSI